MKDPEEEIEFEDEDSCCVECGRSLKLGAGICGSCQSEKWSNNEH